MKITTNWGRLRDARGVKMPSATNVLLAYDNNGIYNKVSSRFAGASGAFKINVIINSVCFHLRQLVGETMNIQMNPACAPMFWRRDWENVPDGICTVSSAEFHPRVQGVQLLTAEALPAPVPHQLCSEQGAVDAHNLSWLDTILEEMMANGATNETDDGLWTDSIMERGRAQVTAGAAEGVVG